MNKEFIAEKWGQIHDSVKDFWVLLTHEDIEYIHGNYEKLISKIQERYGKTRVDAEKDFDKYVTQFTTRTIRPQKQYKVITPSDHKLIAP